jgi:hypothetical protein
MRVLRYMVVLCTLSACELPRRLYVELTVDRSEYVAGETVNAQLINTSPEAIEFGACSLKLERRTSVSWEEVGPGNLPCAAILYTLAAGESRNMVYVLDPSLPQGAYRLRHFYNPARSAETTSTVSATVVVTQTGAGSP